MGKLEVDYERGGLAIALQFLADLRPARTRAYLAAATHELILRPRVSSDHLDSLIVYRVPSLADARRALLEAGLAVEHCYEVDFFQWSEDTAVQPRPMASERRMPPAAERTG